ncbi:unnamed protein product [Heterobilharzia americana]|nr:unnamed protein product [Heterobilharzia americana]
MLSQHNMLVVLIALITMSNIIQWGVSTAQAENGNSTSPQQKSRSSFWGWLKWIVTVICMINSIITTYF